MQKFIPLILFLILASPLYADQLDGLRIIGIVLPALAVMGVSFVVLVIASIYRFLNKSTKPNHILTVSGGVLILAAIFIIFSIGRNIDSGFLTFLVALSLIVGTLIVLNYILKKKNN